METRTIGSLTVPVVGIGCNNFGTRLDERASAAVVHAALDADAAFFDTADIYGDGRSETFLGRALAGRRGDAVIATKFGHRSGGPERGAHPAYVRQALEASLARLGALDDLVRAGLVREVGCSNFDAGQLREAGDAPRAGAARFASVQNEYSLMHREPERGVLAECERQGMALLPYYPLASGLLTGKYRRGRPAPEGTRITAGGRYAPMLNDDALDMVERLAAVAESRGRTLLDLAFGWLLAHPQVASVIAGASSPEQVRANVAAAGRRLAEAEQAEADAAAG